MTVLVIGGAASGKSAYAEELLCALSGGAESLLCGVSGGEESLLCGVSGGAEKVYIATMERRGAEAEVRIARHREARSGRGFRTLERPTDLPGLQVPIGSAALLEDLGNLCANELYSATGRGAGAEASILRGIENLRTRCAHVVIVSNEVFCGGAAYRGDTLSYLRLLARLHRELARRFDAVCEVICGAPLYYKGNCPAVTQCKGAERFANP